MGFLDRLRHRFTQNIVVGSRDLVMGGFTYQNGDLASNETIFSAVSMLAGAIASLPVSVRQDYERVKPMENRISWLLEFGPNPNMTAFEFIRLLETLRSSTGVGYAMKELDVRGQVQALWPVKTACVQPRIERETRELYYRVRDEISGTELFLHNSYMVAVRYIGTDGMTAISPISVLRSSLDYDKEVKEFSIDQMKNGLRAKFAIKMSGSNPLSTEQKQQYDESLRTFFKNGVLILDGKKEVTEFTGQSLIDPKVFEAENITVARVARVYNIPLDKFLPEKTSYSSAEQSDLNYLRDTILPMARMYEQELSKKLLSQQDREHGMQIKFSLNGFARADMKTRGDFYMKGVRTGWFCLDDVRELEDMPPLPNGEGQEHYISKDLVPVRLLGAEYKSIPERGNVN